MYCRKCGTQNDDNAYKCVKCGEILQHTGGGGGSGTAPQQIPNYLAQSILVTLLCCLPLGIPAIVFSAQVNGKVQAGDIQGAMEASRKAKMWGWWSFGVGILVGIIYFFVGMAGAM
ncbi:MAG: CD225/dispanin family protein [Kiritimatiellae bacterium]|nr:CD225/dispanin family protein [Kiritimatiellia bacterium]